MDEWIEEHLEDRECEVLFARLFPHGFAGEDGMAELAPAGWEQAPFLPIFHPSVEQCFEESVRIHNNLQSLFGKKGEPLKPPPTFAEIEASHHDTPIQPKKECADLIARCLWHVFSENNEVVAPDGRAVDIGSFRGAAGFIADCLNRQLGTSEYDYMDFYMGLTMVGGRADVTDVYRMIFRRLRAQQCDWIYHFPQLSVVYLGDMADQAQVESPEAMASYDPSDAFAKEQEQQKRRDEAERMQAEFDGDRRKFMEEAGKAPPPDVVLAYTDVYGHHPKGWPPE